MIFVLAMLLWNKSVSLDVGSYMTGSNQSDSFISDWVVTIDWKALYSYRTSQWSEIASGNVARKIDLERADRFSVYLIMPFGYVNE